MVQDLKDVFDYYTLHSDESNIEKLLKDYLMFTERGLGLYPWKKVKTLYFYGTSGDQRYITPKYYYYRVFGAASRDKTQIAVLGADYRLIKEILSKCGENLKELRIMYTNCGIIDISNLTGLNDVNIDRNYDIIISGLSELRNLTMISIGNAAIGDTLDLRGVTELETLYLRSVPASQVIVSNEMDSVNQVLLYDTQISDYRFLSRFIKLKVLGLSGEKVTSLDNVNLPKSIDRFGLFDSPIKHLPETLRGLKNLENLSLLGLNLDTLPDWLPELGHGFHGAHKLIILNNTTVADMDITIFDQPDEYIYNWFRERAAKRASQPIILNEAKVIFLGDGEAGKTHIIKRLVNNCEILENFDGKTTPGIAFEHQEYERGERKIKVHFWDFGGQEILHSMHRIFLTRDTLYVVVLNARENTQDERALYWLNNIKSFAPDSPVLLALNKIDGNANASLNVDGHRSFYCPDRPELIKEVKLSALEFSADEFRAAMETPILDGLFDLPIIDTPLTSAGVRVKERLLGMDKHYINDDEFAQECQECGVEDSENIRNALLDLFNKLGVSFCCRDRVDLSDYMVLQPRWITNAINTVLFNKKDDIVNGIISTDEIFSILSPTAENREKIKTVDKSMKYKKGDVRYVLGVTREFRLSYGIDDQREFMPMLCGRNQLPIAAEYERDAKTLELQMRYEYLPNNVMHRLMVELKNQLDIKNVWLTGAVFRVPELNWSAMVKSEGNTVKIFARAGDDQNPANAYLGILKSALESINRQLNLTSTSYIIYKEDGKKDEFDYDVIVGSMERGITITFSKVFRDLIPLQRILDKSVSPADSLRADVINACFKAQEDSTFTVKIRELAGQERENRRNKYLANMLSGKYLVYDQTLQGLSAGGMRYGELDMLLRDKQDVPLTIIECLNLPDSGKSKWNEHLDKLVRGDKYNSNGLKALFLISYVECGEDNFTGLWQSFLKHMAGYAPNGYALKRAKPQYGTTNLLQYAECVYEKGGAETTVYCVFMAV